MNCKYCKADCAMRGDDNPKECRWFIPMTIADYIRSLSDEELAVFIADEIPHGDCHNCDLECRTYREGDKFYSCCKNAFYKWLKQPYKEET